MTKNNFEPASLIRNQLHQSGLKARKRLGQHFLTDITILHSIIEASQLSPTDTVIEVGPGLGILTEELARQAGRVIAVELDDNLAKRLRQKLSSFHNVTIVNTDILKTDLSELLGDNHLYKVVANIPYYITSPILQYFVTAAIKPSLMVVMVQKEVGENIAAGPGKLSVQAISLQIYTQPELIIKVPASSFYPIPKVDSVVLRFTFLSQPKVNIEDIESFLEFVRSGFASPRKLLSNSLAKGLGIKPLEAGDIIKKAGISPQKRPEALTISEWETLYQTAHYDSTN